MFSFILAGGVHIYYPSVTQSHDGSSTATYVAILKKIQSLLYIALVGQAVKVVWHAIVSQGGTGFPYRMLLIESSHRATLLTGMPGYVH